MTSDSTIKRLKMFLYSHLKLRQFEVRGDNRKGDAEPARITFFFPKNVKRRTDGRKEGRKGKNE